MVLNFSWQGSQINSIHVYLDKSAHAYRGLRNILWPIKPFGRVYVWFLLSSEIKNQINFRNTLNTVTMYYIMFTYLQIKRCDTFSSFSTFCFPNCLICEISCSVLVLFKKNKHWLFSHQHDYTIFCLLPKYVEIYINI